jgi:hypothetical protein
MTQLQAINLDNFTGGLQTFGSQFNIAPDESPDLLNIEIDPRGGFRTRKGWSRWNVTDAIATVADWAPRNTFIHTLSTGAYVTYVTNDDVIETATSTAIFSTLQVSGPTDVPATASPHLADFAAWGDYVYIACGVDNATHRRLTTGTPTAATDAYGNYNDDYTTPDAIGAGAMPRCEFIETHGGYMFAAYTKENSLDEPNRLRWSHPSQPENWATLDFIDIDAGGGRITGLRSFQDHLLIFKTDSVWALYGYDSESWQLVRVSTTAGAPGITAITASESAVYFYSAALGRGIFAYVGNSAPVLISENLRAVLDAVTKDTDVWIGWVNRRLWCSLPWMPSDWAEGQSSVFVFDPLVGNGSWVRHTPALGYLTCIMEGSELQVGDPLAAITGDSGAAVLVRLEQSDFATDLILEGNVRTAFDAYYTTGWQYAGWPERRKSWRRPRFIVEQPAETVAVDIDTYFDYDEGSSRRSHTVLIDSRGAAFWRATGADELDGFDWGDGTLWGSSGANGSDIVRAGGNTVVLGGLGVNRSIQLRFSTNAEYAGKAWGINLITLKYILRRFTT